MTSLYTYTRMPPTLTDLSADVIHLIAHHVMFSGATPSSTDSMSREGDDKSTAEYDVDGPFVRRIDTGSDKSRKSSRWRDEPTSSSSSSIFSSSYRPVAPQPQQPYRSGLDVLMSAASEVSASSSSSTGSRSHGRHHAMTTDRSHAPYGAERHTPISSHATSSASYSRRASSTSTRSKGVESDMTDHTPLHPPTTSKNHVYATRIIPDPRSLLPLMLTCKHLYKALQFDGNPKLYHWMYLNTFDSEALTRRWKEYQTGGPNHEYAAVPPSKSVGGDSFYDEIQVKQEPGLEPEQISSGQSDNRSCTHGVRENGTKCACREGVHLLSDPVLLANEYKERFETFRRYREIAAGGSWKALMKTEEDKETWSADIWVIWWMYMENDHKNLVVLESLAKFREVVKIFYREHMLAAALQPGYPTDSCEGAILTIISNRLGIDTELEETREQIDTKVFILLPYVFACHKYPFLYGPWVHRDLPLSRVARDEEELRMLSQPNAFMVELSPNPRSTNVKRLGKWWRVSSPYQTTCASLSFMKLLERHPELITLGKNPHVQLPRPGVASSSGQKSVAAKPLSSADENLDSSNWDNDLYRAMNCHDPITSSGMHPLAFRHKIEGLWKGKYLYFDYNAYQHVVKGDVRSLYEGTYGEEMQEWRLEERVINVKIDKVGGDGPMLNAGFRLGLSAEDEEYETSLSVEERGWEPCLDEDAPDRPGWTKEILISGTGLSAWGEVKIHGRVRAWDGLVTIHTDFGIPASTGKWLFRCYIMSGNKLVGRYRDTFTMENMRGYEGPVFLQKQPESIPLVSERVPSSPIVEKSPSGSASNSGNFRSDFAPTYRPIVPSPSTTVSAIRPRELQLPHIQELEYRPDPLHIARLDEPPLVVAPSQNSERARLLAEHRASLAAQPVPILNPQSVLPLNQQPSQHPLRMPLRLPPMSALPPYRRPSWTEADRAQMLWSRSLASDVGSNLSPTDERPASKRPRHY